MNTVIEEKDIYYTESDISSTYVTHGVALAINDNFGNDYVKEVLETEGFSISLDRDDCMVIDDSELEISYLSGYIVVGYNQTLTEAIMYGVKKTDERMKILASLLECLNKINFPEFDRTITDRDIFIWNSQW